MSTNPPQPSNDAPLSIDTLLEAQLPALMVFLRHRTGDDLAARETVEDLAQSVCREILQDLPNLRFESAEKFRGYLFLQAVRKVIDRARFHKMECRDQRKELPLPETRTAGEVGIYGSLITGTRVAAAKEQLAQVERCLQELPDAQREAILLSRIAGLSYAEIASQKGVGESTIRSLAARGLARLYLKIGQAN